MTNEDLELWDEDPEGFACEETGDRCVLVYVQINTTNARISSSIIQGAIPKFQNKGETKMITLHTKMYVIYQQFYIVISNYTQKC